MKIYACPKEIAEPKLGFGEGFSTERMIAGEKAHAEALKAYLLAHDYKGPHTGDILREPHADGYAQYMYADAGAKSVLIHLPYCDAWHSPNVQHLPRKEVLRRIAGRKALAELFAAKAST